MKHLFLSFLYLLGLATLGFADGQDAQKVDQAITAGNILSIQKYFAPNVEVVIDREEGLYSSSQAAFVLQSFFDKNPVESLEVNHKGNSSGNRSFWIINFKTKTNKTYQLYILWVKNSIIQVKIKPSRG